jgi:hypothetical protein
MADTLADILSQLEAGLAAAKANLDAVTAERDQYKALVTDPKLRASLDHCLALAAAMAPEAPAPTPAP